MVGHNFLHFFYMSNDINWTKPRQIVQTEKKFDQESSALLKYPVAMVLSGICHYYELAKLHLRNDIVREPYGNRDKK